MQTLTYWLVQGPAGAQWDPRTGLLRWVTGEAHGDSTNEFVVMVTHNGLPSSSNTLSFIVSVLDSNLSPQFEAQSPVVLSSAGAVEVQWTLCYPADRLTNIAVNSRVGAVTTLAPSSSQPFGPRTEVQDLVSRSFPLRERTARFHSKL